MELSNRKACVMCFDFTALRTQGCGTPSSAACCPARRSLPFVPASDTSQTRNSMTLDQPIVGLVVPMQDKFLHQETTAKAGRRSHLYGCSSRG